MIPSCALNELDVVEECVAPRPEQMDRSGIFSEDNQLMFLRIGTCENLL
jgi:hypothetical protein